MTSISNHNDSFADQILASLGDNLDYTYSYGSWSPFYSDIGLGFNEDAGIAHLFLHYNRRTTTLGSPFLTLSQRPHAVERTALYVRQLFEYANAAYAFYDHNSWVMECTNPEGVQFDFTTASPITEARQHAFEEMPLLLFEGYLPNTDSRDPDPNFPLLLGLRLLCGRQIGGDGITAPLLLGPDESGRLALSFSVQVLDVSHETV